MLRLVRQLHKGEPMKRKRALLSYSQRVRMSNCERKAALEGLLCLAPQKKSKALRFGSLFDKRVTDQISSDDVDRIYKGAEQEAETLAESDSLHVEYATLKSLCERWEGFFKTEGEQNNIRFTHPILTPAGRPHALVEAGGEIDGYCPRSRTLVERKTTGLTIAQRVQNLKVDGQLRSYFFAAEGMGKTVVQVAYRVARKPRLRQKQSETVQEFVSRIVNDILDPSKEYVGEVVLPLVYMGNQDGFRPLLPSFQIELHESARRFEDMLRRGSKKSGGDPTGRQRLFPPRPQVRGRHC